MRAPRCFSWSVRTATAVVAIGSLGCSAAANPQGLVSNDLSRLRSVGGVAASPDGKRVAYLTIDPDSPTKSIDMTFPRELNQLKILDAASGVAVLNLSVSPEIRARRGRKGQRRKRSLVPGRQVDRI